MQQVHIPDAAEIFDWYVSVPADFEIPRVQEKKFMKMSRKILAAACVCLVFSSWEAVEAQGKKGGGGGGSGGGGGGAANSAFVYQDSSRGHLYLCASDGSAKTQLTNSGKGLDRAPVWSPDMDPNTPGHQGWIAFFRQYDTSKIWGGIFIVPSDMSAAPVELRSYRSFDPMPPSGDNLSWTPDGEYLLYASEFDRISALSVSAGNVTLLFQDPQTPEVAGYTYDPALSPDLSPEQPGYQGMMAFSYAFDIVIAPVEISEDGDWAVGALSNLTQTSDVYERHPVWSADGAFLACYRSDFSSNTGRGLSVINVETGVSWPVTELIHQNVRPTWSPDGLYLGFYDAHQVAGKWNTDIFYLSPWTAASRVNVTNSSANEIVPEWNPSWINELP